MATTDEPDNPATTDPNRALDRHYLVFCPASGLADADILHRLVGTYKTLTPEDALTQANADLPADEQNVTTLVPVAARNWQPRTPKVEEPPPPKVSWT